MAPDISTVLESFLDGIVYYCGDVCIPVDDNQAAQKYSSAGSNNKSLLVQFCANWSKF